MGKLPKGNMSLESLDDMKAKAVDKVKEDNPGKTNFRATRWLENLMDGTLIKVSFEVSPGKDDSDQVHFRRDEIRVCSWDGDVLNAVAITRNAFGSSAS